MASVEDADRHGAGAGPNSAHRTGSLRQIEIARVKESNTAGDYVVQIVKVGGVPNGAPSSSAAGVLAEVTIHEGTAPVSFKALTGAFSAQSRCGTPSTPPLSVDPADPPQ